MNGQSATSQEAQVGPCSTEDVPGIQSVEGNIFEELDRIASEMAIGEKLLTTLDPAVQAKFKMITSGYEETKKQVDLMVKKFNSQKQCMRYMGEQNKVYRTKIGKMEAELKQERLLKNKAEKDAQLWKGECQKYRASLHKGTTNKTHAQSKPAQVHDKDGRSTPAKQLQRRLVENTSKNVEGKRHYLPTRDAMPAMATHGSEEAVVNHSLVRLPALKRSTGERLPVKSGRTGHSRLPDIDEGSRRPHANTDTDGTCIKGSMPFPSRKEIG